jgi:hypothetical protein
MSDIVINGDRCRFIPHSGQSPANGLSKLDRFAELLAEGWEVNSAAQAVYGTRTIGNSMLQRIRKRLGPQAC